MHRQLESLGLWKAKMCPCEAPHFNHNTASVYLPEQMQMWSAAGRPGSTAMDAICLFMPLLIPPIAHRWILHGPVKTVRMLTVKAGLLSGRMADTSAFVEEMVRAVSASAIQ